jgi:hypothetical protein
MGRWIDDDSSLGNILDDDDAILSEDDIMLLHYDDVVEIHEFKLFDFSSPPARNGMPYLGWYHIILCYII